MARDGIEKIFPAEIVSVGPLMRLLELKFGATGSESHRLAVVFAGTRRLSGLDDVESSRRVVVAEECYEKHWSWVVVD